MADEAKSLCCLYVGGQIIDEDRPGRVEIESVPSQFEYGRIGFDQPDLSRDDDVFEFADRRGDDGGMVDGLSRPVREPEQADAGGLEICDDLGHTVDRTGQGFVEVLVV